MQWVGDKKAKVENHFPIRKAKLLSEKGCDIKLALASSIFGKGQIIW